MSEEVGNFRVDSSNGHEVEKIRFWTKRQRESRVEYLSRLPDIIKKLQKTPRSGCFEEFTHIAGELRAGDRPHTTGPMWQHPEFKELIRWLKAQTQTQEIQFF